MLKIENNQKRRKNGLIIEPDCGWAGPKPAATKAEKIHQIKTEFIDDRPLLIEGAAVSDFREYPCILESISAQKLIQYIDTLKADEAFLVVLGMDKVSQTEQEKFIPLLKERQLLSSKLPEKIKLLVPVKAVDSVSKEIRSLTFQLKVS